MALFPFNNAATNVYFAFYTYFTYYAIMYLSGSTAAAIGGAVASAGVVLAISTFNSLFAPLMRIFDGITEIKTPFLIQIATPQTKGVQGWLNCA